MSSRELAMSMGTWTTHFLGGEALGAIGDVCHYCTERRDTCAPELTSFLCSLKQYSLRPTGTKSTEMNRNDKDACERQMTKMYNRVDH